VAATLKGEEYPLVSGEDKPSVPAVFLRNNDVVYVFSSEAVASVEVGEKEIQVFGEVNKPGVYRFSALEPCTLMRLVWKMGGLPQYANQKSIKVLRKDKEGNEVEFKVNVEDIMEKGDPEKDFSLETGDRVVVPARRLSIF
jgi:protein involved in polysaccharide export with SLBB domain